jgi:ATP-dependent Lon protease
MDHYMDVPFDLTGVMFITTANVTDTIPAPLLDRMELLELPGYTPEEKVAIARRHLLPKQVAEHGLTAEQVNLSDEMILHIIEAYTREAGVRNLERSLASVCRGVAVRQVEGKWDSPAIDKNLVEAFLGPEQFHIETAERTETPGVATGLAWTATGGEILFVEATRMAGRGKLKLTGQLGDVMKESTQIALSFLEANAEKYGITPQQFADVDIHVHVPAGAIPKDGPSAGVTMFTSLFSLMTDRRVRNDTAMTGEITLRGLVLPVGGIKNKVLAAHRGGVKRIVLPERNRKDLEEVPDQVKREVEFIFVSKVDELLGHVIDLSDGRPLFTAAPSVVPEKQTVKVVEEEEPEVQRVTDSEDKEEDLPRPWL